jgi:hypothetical protein
MRPGGTGGLYGSRPLPGLAGAAIVALGLSCHAQFTGPYPCKEGYKSCLDPAQNLCETDTVADGLHCGSCGVACGVGAACVASRCGQPAARIAPLAGGSPAGVATNSSAVFWHDSHDIFTLPFSAGPDAIPKNISNGDFFTCGNARRAFAVDEANVYYLSNGGGAGLTQVSLTDGTRTVLASAPASGGSNLCGSLAVGATSVYLLVSVPKGSSATYTIYAAEIGMAGQTPKVIASLQSNSGSSNGTLAVNSTALFFLMKGANNVQSFQVLPLDGGPMTALPINVPDYGSDVPFVVDDANLYAVSGGCACGGDNGGRNGSGGLPTGSVVKIPLDGRASTTLAASSGRLGGIALDATNVYWSTDTSVWRVPRVGGAATAIAGNLSNGFAPSRCLTCGGDGQAPPTDVAVGASGVYVAVTGTNENAVLEVAK